MLKNGYSRKKAGGKAAVLIASLALLLTLTVGTVIAFIIDKTENVENTFNPTKITTDITEKFDGEIKKDVNAVNTGDASAYIRIKLISYRVSETDETKVIGGSAAVPEFTPGDGWFEKDGFYYWSSPVAPSASPTVPLIGEEGIELQKYTDADGGKQVIEVMAEAIQSDPTTVVAEKWNVTVNADGTISE